MALIPETFSREKDTGLDFSAFSPIKITTVPASFISLAGGEPAPSSFGATAQSTPITVKPGTPDFSVGNFVYGKFPVRASFTTPSQNITLPVRGAIPALVSAVTRDIVEAIPRTLITVQQEASSFGVDKETVLPPLLAQLYGDETYHNINADIRQRLQRGDGVLASYIGAASEKTLDVVFGASIAASGFESLATVLEKGGTPAQIEAWKTLGSPSTKAEATKNYNALVKQFTTDPAMPGGGNRVGFDEITKARSILEKDGIPDGTKIASESAKYFELFGRETKLGSQPLFNFDTLFKPEVQARPLGVPQLPGYRAEPGQARPAGLSIERQEPVGFGEEARILRGTKGMTADDITRTYPNIKLTKDVPATDIYGNKVQIPEGEKLTPYELKGNKILLQDGETYIVSRNQFENIKGQSVGGEPKPFAPELAGTEETVKADRTFDRDKIYADFDAGKITKEQRNKKLDDLGLANQSKYSQYQLPGGKNYKEVLIKAPVEPNNIVWKKTESGFYEAKVNGVNVSISAPDKNGKFYVYEADGKLGQNANTLESAKRVAEDYLLRKPAGFKSSHWDELNVLAHLRLNARTYKGKKVSFMEELQSDWMREGRTKGFIDESKQLSFTEAKKQAEAKLNEAGIFAEEDMSGDANLVDKNGEPVEYDSLSAESKKLVDTFVGDAQSFAELKKQDVRDAVPNHPLLKDWITLSIKRALLDAVNSGATYFSWINGEQTSARYNLATQVENVKWNKAAGSWETADKSIAVIAKETGKSITIAIDKQGNIVSAPGDRGLVGKKLDEFLGKGLADKIMEKERGTISGEGLKFGGEWATNLYDKQVKNIVENLTGGEVEVIDMGLPVDSKTQDWLSVDAGGLYSIKVKPEDLKVGLGIHRYSGNPSSYIVTNVLGDGRFEAIRESRLSNDGVLENGKTAQDYLNFDAFEKRLLVKNGEGQRGWIDKQIAGRKQYLKDNAESFDISPPKTTTQQAIRLTPEIKAKIRGESPEIKTSGKQFVEAPDGGVLKRDDLTARAGADIMAVNERENFYKISPTERKDVLGQHPIAKGIGRSPLALTFKKAGTVKFPGTEIKHPADIAFAFRELKNNATESFYIVALKDNKPVGVELLTVGTIQASLVDPFDVLPILRKLEADAFFAVHNHPSGDPTPSTADVIISNRIQLAARDFGIDWRGHIVINHTEFGFVDPIGYERKLPMRPDGGVLKSVPRYTKYLKWNGDIAGLPKIENSVDMANLMKGLSTNWGKNSAVFFTDVHMRVLFVEVIPKKKISASLLGDLATKGRAKNVFIGNLGIGKADVHPLHGRLKNDYAVNLIDIVDLKNGRMKSAVEEGLIRDEPVGFGPEKKLKASRELKAREEVEKLAERTGTRELFAEKEREKRVEREKGIPRELEALATEARKYKSAEEFKETFEPTVFYHGTSPENAAKIRKNGFNTKEVALTSDRNEAKEYGPEIIEVSLRKERQDPEYLKNNPESREPLYRSEDIVPIPESQLIDFYNRAVETPSPTAPGSAQKPPATEGKKVPVPGQGRALTEGNLDWSGPEMESFELSASQQKASEFALDPSVKEEERLVSNLESIFADLKGVSVSELKGGFTDEELTAAQMHYNFALESMMDNPARALGKYASRSTGRLPEVTGTEMIQAISGSGRMIKNSEFGRHGDDIADQLGFPSSEAARDAYENYIDQKKRLVEIQNNLREIRATIRLAKLKDKFVESSKRTLASRVVKDIVALKNLVQAANRAGFTQGRKAATDRLNSMVKRLKDRRSKIRALQSVYNLTDGEMRDIRGVADPRFMDAAEFDTYYKDLEEKAQAEHRRSEERVIIESIIKERNLQKTENLQRALDLPPVKDMTLEQLFEFDAALSQALPNDTFLGPRMIQTVINTDIGPVKTVREIRESLAKQARVGIHELADVRGDWGDSFNYDASLATKNPLYKYMVEQFTAKEIEYKNKLLLFKKRMDTLAFASRKSRRLADAASQRAGRADKSGVLRRVAERLIPEDEKVVGWLEAGINAPGAAEREAARAHFARQLTNEELEFAQALDKLFQHYYQIAAAGAHIRKTLLGIKLSRFSGTYFPHNPRSFLERWKHDGIVQAVRTMWSQVTEARVDFDAVGPTGEVLGYEKFLKYALKREGVGAYSNNAARVALAYAHAFEKKLALDAIIPKVDAYVFSLQRSGPGLPTDPTGENVDGQLKEFVREWLNNKKGRRAKLLFAQGSRMDSALRAFRLLLSLKDLGINIVAGLASSVGNEVSDLAGMDLTKEWGAGKLRALTKQGRKIGRQYPGVIGEPPFENVISAANTIGNTFLSGAFYIFQDLAYRARRQFLLGLLTPEEFATGKISLDRQARIKLRIARFHPFPEMRSVKGSTTEATLFNQYKEWMVPILLTAKNNLQEILKRFRAASSLEEKIKLANTKEMRELFKLTIGGLGIYLFFHTILADDPDDQSFIAKLKRRVIMESASTLQALNPGSWLKIRMWTFAQELYDATATLATLERYKTSGAGYKKGDLKAVNQFKRIVRPAIIRQFQDLTPPPAKTSGKGAMGSIDFGFDKMFGNTGGEIDFGFDKLFSGIK